VTIAGDPDRLEQYSSTTLPLIGPTHDDASTYGAAIADLDSAASTIPLFVPDYSAWIAAELGVIDSIDRRPAAFAFALRQLDHFVAETPRDRTYLYTNDSQLFDALVAARLAHPAASDAATYEMALNAVTGSPTQLAGQLEGVISNIDQAMGSDDVNRMKDELLRNIQSLHDANGSLSPPLTDLEIVRQAWMGLNANGDTNVVSEALVQQLQDVTDLLGRRRFDPAFTTAFFDALGPQFASLLPQAISLASWSDYQRTSGQSQFPIQDVLANVDTALASASPNLDATWRDDFFASAVDDHTLNDAFPLLFEFGQFSVPFAQAEGQLGLDVLHGTVTVDRGMGSPGYPNFDALETHWEDRGTVLVDAAARTPAAASALLSDPNNASWLTGNDFGRTGGAQRHPPSWDVIAPCVRNLIVSGTVYEAQADPSLARDAAASVINASIAAKPGDASTALAPAYGQMVLQYLPDFARSPSANLSAANRGDYLSIGAMQAAQFTSLAMHDSASKTAIFQLRDALDLQTVVLGTQTSRPMYPSWQQRVANIDGIVLSADNGEVFVSARERDEEAKQYNDNLDLFQGLAMNIIGLADFPGSSVVDTVIDKTFDQLKSNYLYQDTNNAVHAGYTTNVASFSAFDHERIVVAEGQLIAAIHTEQSGGALSADQAEFIDHAEQMLGQPYVDALRVAAQGGVSVPAPVDARSLQEWAGNTPLGGFTDVSNYTDGILPRDGTSLWPH
jgi:hypothetical protein